MIYKANGLGSISNWGNFIVFLFQIYVIQVLGVTQNMAGVEEGSCRCDLLFDHQMAPYLPQSKLHGSVLLPQQLGQQRGNCPSHGLLIYLNYQGNNEQNFTVLKDVAYLFVSGIYLLWQEFTFSLQTSSKRRKHPKPVEKAESLSVSCVLRN